MYMRCPKFSFVRSLIGLAHWLTGCEQSRLEFKHNMIWQIGYHTTFTYSNNSQTICSYTLSDKLFTYAELHSMPIDFTFHTFLGGFSSRQSRVVVDGVVDGMKGEVDVVLLTGVGIAVPHGLEWTSTLHDALQRAT